MKDKGIILVLCWMLFRLTFHSFSFDNSKIAEFLYFVGNDIGLIGLFLLLYKSIKSGYLKRLLKVVLIYTGFCLLTDILMLCGIGAHDFWLYTAISISILSIGVLWARL
jgi:hypothetical protein